MKDHPNSPVKKADVRLDGTNHSYVIRDGVAYRIKTRLIEVRSRRFQAWTELGDVVGPARLVIR